MGAYSPIEKNAKLRPFLVAKIIFERTDEDNYLTIAQILDILKKEYGIESYRKTIQADIDTLIAFGFDIQETKSTQNRYNLVSRQFDNAELKLLIDAVQSSRFLTEKKSRELIEKLCNQCSVYDARLMRRDVVVSGRVKSMNETIYYNVDTIQDAIAENRQISFRYFDFDLDRQRVYRNRDYIASPYGLCQDNENCYLLALSPRHGVTSYRVDRMSEIQVLEQSRVPCPELNGKALVEHANRLFQMYSGQTADVKLRFHRSLINVVIDRFGRDILLIPDGEEHFVFTVNVAVSPMFLSWVIGFGNKAKILYPQSVVEACKAMCQSALEQY